MKQIAFLIFAFTSLVLPAQPFAEYTPGLKNAQKKIFELRLDEARLILSGERKLRPENRISNYLEVAGICTQLFANGTEQEFQQQLSAIENGIEKVEEIPKDQPLRNVLLGEIRMALASLHSKFDNQLKSAWQFYKAYELLVESQEKFPDFERAKLPLGMLYAGIGSLPEEYRGLAARLGFKGDVGKGLKLMEEGFVAVKNEKHLKNLYGFCYSYTCLQLDADCSHSPSYLGLELESNLFLIYLESKHFLQTNQASLALKILINAPNGNQYSEFPFLDYFTANVAVGLDNVLAKKRFATYLENSRTDNFKKSTFRYLAWISLLENDRASAEEFRQKVLETGSEKVGADRQAMEEARRGFNTLLVKARLLYDAGKLSEANMILLQNPVEECCIKDWEKQEYFYRKGRSAQASGVRRAARLEFEKVLAQTGPQNTYAWGNSALQLAIIYESYDNLEKAEEYYQMALKSKGYAFCQGIQQKAQAGLQRLEMQ